MRHARAASRLVALAVLVAWSLATGSLSRTPAQRARWMQRLSRRILLIMHATVEVTGAVPRSGLIVCNHLGYLDVLAIGSLLPAVFVAKNDVRAWPAIGWLCRLAGTIFVSRDQRAAVRASVREMSAALGSGLPVVVFPEGTSTGGSSVLPFKTSLLLAVGEHSSTPAAISYELAEGSVQDELCYWRDIVFAPHFWNVLTKEKFRAHVRFGVSRPPGQDRKLAACSLHRDVRDLLLAAGSGARF